MRRFSILIVATVCLLAATSASAVTVDQIVSLSKAGVSEAVILALLDRDRTVLTIDPEQIVALKREGLSDTLITAMLRNGRDEAEEAARDVASWNAATMLASLANTPDVVVVGHGPDRPNTTHTEDWYSGFRDGIRVPSASHRGSSYAGSSYAGSSYTKPAYRSGLKGQSLQAQPVRPPMLCLAQVNTAAGPGPSYVTECPAVMQRSLRSR
jgi:hypothetical protein